MNRNGFSTKIKRNRIRREEPTGAREEKENEKKNKWTAPIDPIKRFLIKVVNKRPFATERAASDNNGFIIQFHFTSYNNIL